MKITKTGTPMEPKEAAFVDFVIEALCATSGKTWGQMGEEVALQILANYTIRRKRDEKGES